LQFYFILTQKLTVAELIFPWFHGHFLKQHNRIVSPTP
jgi:hypothetical protein